MFQIRLVFSACNNHNAYNLLLFYREIEIWVEQINGYDKSKVQKIQMSKFWVIFIHCVKSPKIFCVRSANGKERKERKCFSAKVVYYLLCKLLDSDLEKENTKKDFFAFRYFSTTFQIAFFSCNILHALHMQSARLKSFYTLTLLIHQIRHLTVKA